MNRPTFVSIIACAFTLAFPSVGQDTQGKILRSKNHESSSDIDAIRAEARADAHKVVSPDIPKEKQIQARRNAALNRPEILKKTGGFLDIPSTGVSIVVLDTRQVPGGAVHQFAMVFKELSKTNVKVVTNTLAKGISPFAAANTELTNTKAAFALCVADIDGEAPLAVYPEKRIAVIDATALKGGKDSLAPEVRIVKELWRGLGFVGGLGYSRFSNDVHLPVYSVAELDMLEYQVMQPMHFDGIYKEMVKFGVHRARHIPYRLAVFEGWAASPTNEYQKIVWDEVKAWQATNAMKKASSPAR